MAKTRTRKSYVETAPAESGLVAVVKPVVDQVLIPPPDVLDVGDVIRDERDQTITIDGVPYHHIREAVDGRWIYAPVRVGG